MALAVLVVFLKPINTFLDFPKQSDNLNCHKFIYQGDINNPLSYNSSLESNIYTCSVLNLIIPLLIGAFVTGFTLYLLYGQQEPQQEGNL